LFNLIDKSMPFTGPCASPIVPTMNANLFCTTCGASNLADARFCNRCGAALPPVPGTAPVSTSGLSPAAVTPAGAVHSVPVSPLFAARYGGFWIRFVAIIIDAIIIRVVIAPIGFMFAGLGWLGGITQGFPHRLPPPALFLVGGGITALLIIVGQWLYEAFLLSSSYQATPGKMIFGMKVTDLQGNRISFARASGRHFAKYLSAMFLCVGFIMAGFTARKQALHDILAGTIVGRF